MKDVLLKQPAQQNDEALREMLLQEDVISNFSSYYGSSLLESSKAFGEYRKHVRRSNKAKSNLSMDIMLSEGGTCIGVIGLSSSDRGDSSDASLLLVLARPYESFGRTVLRSYIDLLCIHAQELRLKTVSIHAESAKKSQVESLCKDCGFVYLPSKEKDKRTLSHTLVRPMSSANANRAAHDDKAGKRGDRRSHHEGKRMTSCACLASIESVAKSTRIFDLLRQRVQRIDERRSKQHILARRS
jgi:hypothetical protein